MISKRRRTDLRLDIVNGVGGLDLKGDGLARQGLDEAGRLKVSICCLLRAWLVDEIVVTHICTAIAKLTLAYLSTTNA